MAFDIVVEEWEHVGATEVIEDVGEEVRIGVNEVRSVCSSILSAGEQGFEVRALFDEG
jgi:hypothetical protein